MLEDSKCIHYILYTHFSRRGKLLWECRGSPVTASQANLLLNIAHTDVYVPLPILNILHAYWLNRSLKKKATLLLINGMHIMNLQHLDAQIRRMINQRGIYNRIIVIETHKWSKMFIHPIQTIVELLCSRIQTKVDHIGPHIIAAHVCILMRLVLARNTPILCDIYHNYNISTYINLKDFVL